MYILIIACGSTIITEKFSNASDLIDHMKKINIDYAFFNLISGETIKENGHLFSLIEV